MKPEKSTKSHTMYHGISFWYRYLGYFKYLDWLKCDLLLGVIREGAGSMKMVIWEKGT